MNAQHRQWQPVRFSPAPSREMAAEAAPEAQPAPGAGRLPEGEPVLDVERLLDRVASAVGDVPALLAIAQQAGRSAPKPGDGRTARLWELLASVAAVDVAAARVLEPHLDAGAILSQAGAPGSFTGSWGVYAAEAPGTRLTAAPASVAADGRPPAGAEPAGTESHEPEQSGTSGSVQLTGSKPWCSLAQFVDHAVVTAHTVTGGRAAFAVDLRAAGVTCDVPEWTSRGLREIPSGTVHFDGVPAVPLGGDGWYFQRPGFAWGGMGVAACWLGGAVALGRHFEAALQRGARSQREADQVALAALGEVDRILTSTVQYLARAAEAVDAAEATGAAQTDPDSATEAAGAGTAGGWSEALRVRGTVAAAVERVQLLVSQNLGPGPLALDERYGKCMADLSLYVRQHHATRDDAQLGVLTLKGEHGW
ncbi:acyl-CoA/acyl-ACP dehydrogenase [Arthrobacter sp. FW305-BF8]|uniref:acyl-CoA dehydrogenase family protein n=1 Tax=Arthrobacter sp. FW305-BF8 TaxID=2879617 RepID=UPI001F215C94|nr:acyl-CoA dehydrogenase family protein [Arthrobacter sp. FW305-BF8]UKA54848.1 acyl-CoA/acyl-ACP dehydrogenase [Arthrobacter sp. FW305-BF8]